MLKIIKSVRIRNGQEDFSSRIALCFVFIAIILYLTFLQYIAPTLYGSDGYYHLAIANFIKELGPRYEFKWMQFSLHKDSYADKDFAFHLFIMPFLYFIDNPIKAGKCAIICFNILFLLVFAAILKKYLSNFLTACFLLLPFCSVSFSVYSLFLHPALIGNTATLIGIYFLITKKWVKLFVLTLLYSLLHFSFFVLVLFGLLAEIVRFIQKKEFFFKNIYALFLGSILGFLIHPNNPHNWLWLYLNVFVLAGHTLAGTGISPAGELLSSSMRGIFQSNFTVFFSVAVIMAITLFSKVKAVFSTLVWWVTSSFYLLLAFFCDRFWYTTNVLFFIFFASFLKDWAVQRQDRKTAVGVSAFIAGYIFLIFLFMPSNFTLVAKNIEESAFYNRGLEKAGYWMRKNIPPGETIYHDNILISSRFLCLNPNNNYLSANDPIYMYYYSPEIYKLYAKLSEGRLKYPYKVFRKVLRARYGYTAKFSGLYQQIKNDSANFRILYGDNIGVVFEVLEEQ